MTMSMTKGFKRVEKKIDFKMQKFFKYHPFLGLVFLFFVVPIVVLLGVCLGSGALILPVAWIMALL